MTGEEIPPTICYVCQQPVGDEVTKYGGEPVHPDCIPLPDSMQEVDYEPQDRPHT